MAKTYIYDNNIYSLDMIFAYINIFKPKIKNVSISDLTHMLRYKGCGNPTSKIDYSLIDVIKNPKKYKKEMKHIDEVDMTYPIIIYNNYVIDGVYRLAKASLDDKKKIKAYVFTEKKMGKFLIDDDWDVEKVAKLEIYDYIKIFYERFCR